MRRAHRLRDELEQEIVTGVLRPGDRLDETTLATRFGVSRTPIREALMQLETAGLIKLHPNRGAFVASLSLKEVLERFEMMASLEGMCGALAARRITSEQLTALLAIHEACEREAKTRDSDKYYYENERFHHAIYEACNNLYLADAARQLHQRLKPYRRLQLRTPHRVLNSLKEHKLIVDAIAAGESEIADKALRDHILIQGERLSDFIVSFDMIAAS